MENWQPIEEAKTAALNVLLHNANGPFSGLPRTAGWGYPEPYTRDLMLSILGIAVSGNAILLSSIQKVMVTLANNQTERGHIPSLVHDKGDRGASDTTPLFLLGVGIFRKVSGDKEFLKPAVEKALTWMEKTLFRIFLQLLIRKCLLHQKMFMVVLRNRKNNCLLQANCILDICVTAPQDAAAYHMFTPFCADTTGKTEPWCWQVIST